MSRFSVEMFFVSRYQNKSQGNRSLFHKVSRIEIFLDRMGTSRSLMEKFLSQAIEKLRRDILLCFTKPLVSKNFVDK